MGKEYCEMASMGRFVMVGLFVIYGLVIYSCSSEKESGSGGDGGEITTNTGGSGGSGALEPGDTGLGQGGEPSNTGGIDITDSGIGTDTGGSTVTPVCGNGILDDSEQCDCGNDGNCSAQELNNATCESLGSGTGILSCDQNCVFDMSMCTPSDDADAGGEGSYGTDSAVDAGTADCTPVVFDNPGNVANPEVVKVDPTVGALGHPFGWTEAVKDFDYVEEEFFITGTTPSPYTTRILVRRPRDPVRFTGTVFMEWYNVSGMIDFDPLWTYSWDYFMREGHVEVSVSAQTIGVNQLKTIDPERYAPINHGDEFAADAIFSQAAMAIRSQSDLILGPCMPVDAVIGMGQSQSSMRLSAYINATAPNDKIYDGFITHTGMEPASNDPGFPTFVIFSMTEGNGGLSDGPNLVKWVVAGATHTDNHTVSRGERAGADIGLDVSSVMQCNLPLNAYPSWRVYNAVCDWMHRWVRFGERPPSGTPLQGSGGLFGSGYELDENGNVLGGVRLPELDVPIATYSTTNSAAAGSDPAMAMIAMMACGLGGSTDFFTEEKLLQLYPTHEDYVQKYTVASEKAVADGFLLEKDSKTAIEEAKNASIPN